MKLIFFLILEDENYEKLIKNLKEEYFENIIKKIKKYFISKVYLN